MIFPKSLKELRDYVQLVVRKSEKDKLDLGDLARQDEITMSQISDYSPPPTDPYGQVSFSGTGAATSFATAHGQAYTPWVVATANSAAAKNIAYVLADATNITFYWDVAPPAGTNNVVITFILKASNL